MLKRCISPFTINLLKNEYGEKLNKDNIQTFSNHKVKKILKSLDDIKKTIYLHHILSEWIESQEINLAVYMKLKRVIRKLKIELNIEEKHDLLLLEERLFSEERHIKKIEVNNPLGKNEHVGVKFVNAKLYTDDNGLKLIGKSDLLISNHRIIFPHIEEFFRFSKILWYSYESNGFKFKVLQGSEYLIRIHDQITLNNTIKNIIGKKVKNAIKKRKDN